MDRSAFHQVLVPELARAGLQGTYLNKAGTVKEGEAIFFSASKWRQAAQKDLEMRQCFSPAALAPGACLSSPQMASLRPSASVGVFVRSVRARDCVRGDRKQEGGIAACAVGCVTS